MKRGKDDEQIIGPMFPRLHVNDKEKGGPRAPPRNKMALYEQLCIPSQRLGPGLLPCNRSNNSNLVPPGPSGQRSGHERNLHFPHYITPSTPTSTHLVNKSHSRQPTGRNWNSSLQQAEQRRELRDEDDFRVPVFVHSGMGQNLSKTENRTDGETFIPFRNTHSHRSLKIQNVTDKNPKCTGFNLRQNVRNQREENLEVCVSSSDCAVRSSTNLRTREKISKHEEKANASPNRQTLANPSRLCDNDVCLQQDPKTWLQRDDSGQCDSVPERAREREKGNIPQPGSDFCSTKDCSSPSEPDIDSQCHGEMTCAVLQLENRDKSNDVSDTSVVDSVSALDISPDDVVEVIGQKHFWKARRAIVNQQRVFAVQVFELHRLIKVQRLIAGSPHLLLEDSTFLGKCSNGSPAENLPSACGVTPPMPATKHQDDSEKPSHKLECSAENAVGKTSLSSVKNGSQPSNYGPFSGNQAIVPMATDTLMAPWCFQQSLGQQWLVPVMSPSEGLIYKPYSAPGFMGSVCGGCGTFVPVPLTGNFVNPAYGISSSHHHHHHHHHHQGMVLPGASPSGHGYFPPCGMPVVNSGPGISDSSGSVVEQMNCFTVPGSNGQSGQLSGSRANLNMQHQSSCNVPTQESGAVSQVRKFQAPKDTELQVSTGSSPSERVQGAGTAYSAEGRDPLSVFSMAPAAPERAPEPRETDQPTRVIKVVPHNPLSATVSAARIFQSIQEERKQY